VSDSQRDEGLRIVWRSPGDIQVEVGGKDIVPLGVLVAVDIHLDDCSLPQVTLDLELPGLDFDSDPADVEVSAEVAEVLEHLGWHPPGTSGPTRAQGEPSADLVQTLRHRVEHDERELARMSERAIQRDGEIQHLRSKLADTRAILDGAGTEVKRLRGMLAEALDVTDGLLVDEANGARRRLAEIRREAGVS